MAKRKSKLSQINVKRIAQDVRKPAGFILGIMAGKGIAKFIDRNKTVQGLIGYDGKKLLKPIGIGVGGLVINQLVRNQDIKNVGMGMAIYGGITGLEAATGKPVISGLGETDGYYTQLPSYADEVAALPASESTNVAREINRLMEDDNMEGIDDLNNDLVLGIEGDDDFDDDIEGIDGDDDNDDEDIEGIDGDDDGFDDEDIEGIDGDDFDDDDGFEGIDGDDDFDENDDY